MARLLAGTSSSIITVTSAHVAGANNAFSVAAWVNAAGTAVAKTIYGEGNSGASATRYFILCSTTNKLQVILVTTGTTFWSATGTITVADGTWHHVAYSQAASGAAATYVDGVLDISNTWTPTAVTFNAAGIGYEPRAGGVTNPLPGTLQHEATWTRQLSAKEIAALASGLPPSFLGAAHYWPLWGKDSPEPDIGISTHVPGTLTGTSLANGGRVHPDLLCI